MKDLAYLHNYYAFDDAVVEAVAEAAEQQDRMPFETLAAHYDIESSLKTFVPPSAKKPIQTLEFTPKDDYDTTAAHVYHLPMANALSPNMIMRGMRMFAVRPHERLILQANPSGPGMPEGKISVSEAASVFHTRSLEPFVTPLLRHLHDRAITQVTNSGYSYGADKALTAVQWSSDYEIEATQAVYVEPVSVEKRTMLGLAAAFGASNAQLARYVAETDSKSYQAERDKENLVGFVGYIAALSRVSNLAIAKTLATDSFRKRVRDTQTDFGTRTAIAWGTKSELAPDRAMSNVASRLQDSGHAFTFAMRLYGMHHAGGDNIDLHAAIIEQGLRATAEPTR